MQLVDNVYLPNQSKADHDLKYKIVQAKLAEQLEGKHSARTGSSTATSTTCPYGTVGGQTAYGVGAASQMFFDKPVWKLDLAQAALLAGLPQAPSEYNPFIDPAPPASAAPRCCRRWCQADYITQAQANAANRKPLEVKSATTPISVRKRALRVRLRPAAARQAISAPRPPTTARR